MAKKKRQRAQVPVRRSDLPSPTLLDGGRFDLTYKRIAGLAVQDKSFEMSLFTGAVLEDCHFRNVNFDRCDFAGTKFVDCTFDHCSLVPAEVRSCFLNRCDFRACNFDGSQWAATQVEKCRFIDCSFVSATIRETVYVDAEFTHCALEKGSITLNKFTGCQFEEIDLGDCTALFLFFDRCAFARSRFSIECIGYTYGLTLENLEAISLSYLGTQVTTRDNEPMVEMLLASYLDRDWYVGACALELNFRKLSPAHSLRLLTNRLAPDIARNRRMDWDELQFLSLILQRLNDDGRLPLIGIWSVFRLVEGAYVTLQEDFPGSRSFSSAPELVLGRLEKLLNEAINAISQMFPSGSSKKSFDLELHFHSRPTLPLDRLVPAPLLAIFDGTYNGPRLLSTCEGSWIEVWQVVASVFAVVQMTLVAVNGMMGQLVKLGENSEKLIDAFRHKKVISKSARQPKKAKRKQRSGGSMVLLVPTVATLTDQRNVALNRVVDISEPDLRKLDKLVVVLSNLPDATLEAFGDYVAPRLEGVHLNASPRAKRRH